MVGLLRLQVDLLQNKTDTGRLRKNISHIDELLIEINEAKREVDTAKPLDPLVPIAALIRDYFSLEDMNDLAFEIGITPERISGDTTQVRSRNLVIYADNRGVLADLLRTCEIKRPLVDWPPVPDKP
jgi:hypothetical protein